MERYVVTFQHAVTQVTRDVTLRGEFDEAVTLDNVEEYAELLGVHASHVAPWLTDVTLDGSQAWWITSVTLPSGATWVA